jgi:hypothetical protein
MVCVGHICFLIFHEGLFLNSGARLVVTLAEWAEASTSEQNDPLQLLVEEEVVEAPERSVLSEWI